MRDFLERFRVLVNSFHLVLEHPIAPFSNEKRRVSRSWLPCLLTGGLLVRAQPEEPTFLRKSASLKAGITRSGGIVRVLSALYLAAAVVAAVISSTFAPELSFGLSGEMSGSFLESRQLVCCNCDVVLRQTNQLTPQRIKELARAGAETVLKQLRAEIIAIERTFPELELPANRRVVTKTIKRIEKRGSQMSTAARKAVSARMKRYWAERRKAKAKVK